MNFVRLPIFSISNPLCWSLSLHACSNNLSALEANRSALAKGCLYCDIRGLTLGCLSVRVTIDLALIRGMAWGALEEVQFLFLNFGRLFISDFIVFKISLEAVSLSVHSLINVKWSVSLINIVWIIWFSMRGHKIRKCWGLFSRGIIMRLWLLKIVFNSLHLSGVALLCVLLSFLCLYSVGVLLVSLSFIKFQIFLQKVLPWPFEPGRVFRKLLRECLVCRVVFAWLRCALSCAEAFNISRYWFNSGISFSKLASWVSSSVLIKVWFNWFIDMFGVVWQEHLLFLPLCVLSLASRGSFISAYVICSECSISILTRSIIRLVGLK